MTMIALGGSIGTGLFLASGTAISTAGPGGALLAYAAVGIMVYFLMTSLGELATFMPDSGSFNTYAARFVDPALGFAMGWNLVQLAVTIAAELAAATVLIKYWFPDSSSMLWSLLFLVLIFCLEYPVRQGIRGVGILVCHYQSGHSHYLPECRCINDLWYSGRRSYRLQQLHYRRCTISWRLLRRARRVYGCGFLLPRNRTDRCRRW